MDKRMKDLEQEIIKEVNSLQKSLAGKGTKNVITYYVKNLYIIRCMEVLPPQLCGLFNLLDEETFIDKLNDKIFEIAKVKIIEILEKFTNKKVITNFNDYNVDSNEKIYIFVMDSDF